MSRLRGPVQPVRTDPTYQAEAFFASDGTGKGKKNGNRKTARKNAKADDSVARSVASVSEGRGLNNDQALFVASIAQQSSAASMHHQGKMVD